MTEHERTKAGDVLEDLFLDDDPLTAHLAQVLSDVVDWSGKIGEPQLDERRAGERLLPMVVGAEADPQPPSRIVEHLAWIARRLGNEVPLHAELWGRLQGIICDLAVHAARELATERGRDRLVRSAPIVDLGRRRILVSVVGIEDGTLLVQVVDRALRALDRCKPRRVLVVLEDVSRLKEPALRQLAEECSARRIDLDPVAQLPVD